MMLACNVIIAAEKSGVILRRKNAMLATRKRELYAVMLTSKEKEMRSLGSSKFTSSTLAIPSGETLQRGLGGEKKFKAKKEKAKGNGGRCV